MTEQQDRQLDLDAISARADAASPAPWATAEHNYVGLLWVKARRNDPAERATYYGTAEDAEFIAHAREDVPALVAEVRRLRARIEKVLALAPFRFADCDDLDRNLGDPVLWQGEVVATLQGGSDD